MGGAFRGEEVFDRVARHERMVEPRLITMDCGRIIVAAGCCGGGVVPIKVELRAAPTLRPWKETAG